MLVKGKSDNFAEDFFNKYPKATLQDLYKGSFQDYFGAAHPLTDREAVKRYIQTELQADTLLPDPLYRIIRKEIFEE